MNMKVLIKAKERLRSLTFPFLLHQTISVALKRVGFKWEIRRSGELQLGLWRHTIRKQPPGTKIRRLVLVPGFGDSALSWIPVLALLTPQILSQFDEWIVFDFPGFQGFLSRNKAFHSMDLLSSEFTRAIESLHPSVLVGHSLGAWLSAMAALNLSQKNDQKSEPFSLEQLVLLSASGVAANEAELDVWGRKFYRSTEVGFENFRPHLFRKEPWWFRYFTGELHQFFFKPEVKEFIFSIGRQHFLPNDLASTRAEKVWLLWGEHDSLAPPEWAQEWKKRFGPIPTEVRILPNSGHALQIENPVGTYQLLSEVLKSTPKKLPRSGELAS